MFAVVTGLSVIKNVKSLPQPPQTFLSPGLATQNTFEEDINTELSPFPSSIAPRVFLSHLRQENTCIALRVWVFTLLFVLLSLGVGEGPHVL